VKKNLATLFLCCLWALPLPILGYSCYAADPVPTPAIRFPVLPNPPSPPQPPVNPTAPVVLAPGVLYVFDSDTDLNADAFPEGVLTVTKIAGPVSISGVFVDGTGDDELRTFSGKFVHVVKAAKGSKGGLARLVVVPDTVGGWKARVVKQIQVGPVVPPVPIPVDPPVPSDPLAAAVQAAYTAETDPAKSTQLALLTEVFTQGSTDIVMAPTVKTTADLFAKMLAVRKAVIPDTALTKVRAVVDADIIAVIGKTVVPMDATMQAKAKAEFAKLGQILSGVR
jgi:hypothetical protein